MDPPIYDGPRRAEGVVVLASIVAPAVIATCAALLVACGDDRHQGTPSATEPGCSVSASVPDVAQRAVAEAVPGTTLCLSGKLRETDLVIARSGERDRPIRILGVGGVSLRSVTVTADQVIVEGVATVDGDGLVLHGRHLVARRNTVRAATADGISCDNPCSNVVIEDNLVVEADGSGIIVEGDRVTVRDNAVSGSVRRDADDADGIRFFGTNLEIVGNTISDIKDDGYPGSPPHTDCFQTYDNGRPPTVGAVISDNVCRNVDHQCLIVTAEEAGTNGVIGRSREVTFARNRCSVGGSQAVLVRWVPDVAIIGNSFEGSSLDRAAAFLNGATGGTFVDNAVPAAVVPYLLDAESETGFFTDRPA